MRTSGRAASAPNRSMSLAPPARPASPAWAASGADYGKACVKEQNRVDEDRLIAALASLYHEREIAEDEIERRTKQSGLVCGVWPDSTKPHRFDEVLKGGKLLQQSKPRQITITVVPCKSRDEAIRIRNMFL
jgi:hypothetical protein